MNLIEIEDELLRDDVLDRWPERYIVIAGKRSEGGVGARALGDEVLRAGFGSRGILWNGGLDALNGEPVGCRKRESMSETFLGREKDNYNKDEVQTCESSIARYLGQGRIDQLLEIHLLILNVKQRLSWS